MTWHGVTVTKGKEGGREGGRKGGKERGGVPCRPRRPGPSPAGRCRRLTPSPTWRRESAIPSDCKHRSASNMSWALSGVHHAARERWRRADNDVSDGPKLMSTSRIMSKLPTCPLRRSCHPSGTSPRRERPQARPPAASAACRDRGRGSVARRRCTQPDGVCTGEGGRRAKLRGRRWQ